MKLSDLAKRMIISILVISVVCLIGSIIYHRSFAFLPFLFGTIIGVAVSIFKVFLLENAVDKALTMDKNAAVKYITAQYFLRMLVSGVALVIGALVPKISLWGVAAGVLAFPLATYREKYISKRNGKSEAS
ncbi:MAG: ATP synthase subunit I [Clostridiaceae bacterium]|jgi:glucan phosphoethanolaminetransferase (alkaline phosphatase superfamily)|nr:ATP synthase subunit I [Clostridiaceae bacterium]